MIEGREADATVPLTDGRSLRVSLALFLERTKGTTRLKVEKSIYQYQLDAVGDRWIVRYDYLRHPPDPHPGAHAQIRGALVEGSVLPPGQTLERIHFPTGRVSLEAVLRLLIEQFGVPPNEPAQLWRAALAESESAFLPIAHRQISGPAS